MILHLTDFCCDFTFHDFTRHNTFCSGCARTRARTLCSRSKMLHHERSNKTSETAVTRSPPPQPPATQPSLPPAPPPPETDGYLTVLVTPKITFSLPRHTAWRTADDIGQELLRDAFLTRFPMRFDAEKLNFTCTTPALPLEGRSRLVYRISSAGDDEERVLLHILSALDKAYAKHFEKRFEEVRSDMLSSSMNFQIVADEVRLAQEAAEGKWEKAVKGLKEQLSVNQKRLFLLEREKEGLLKTVQTSDEQVVRLRRSVDALGVENDRMRTRQGDLESQIVALRELVTSVVGASASTAPTASAASAGPTTPAEVGAVVGADPGGAPCASGVAAASSSSVGTPPTTASMPAGTAAASSSSVGTQTARAGSPPPRAPPPPVTRPPGQAERRAKPTGWHAWPSRNGRKPWASGYEQAPRFAAQPSPGQRELSRWPKLCLLPRWLLPQPSKEVVVAAAACLS